MKPRRRKVTSCFFLEPVSGWECSSLSPDINWRFYAEAQSKSGGPSSRRNGELGPVSGRADHPSKQKQQSEGAQESTSGFFCGQELRAQDADEDARWPGSFPELTEQSCSRILATLEKIRKPEVANTSHSVPFQKRLKVGLRVGRHSYLESGKIMQSLTVYMEKSKGNAETYISVALL